MPRSKIVKCNCDEKGISGWRQCGTHNRHVFECHCGKRWFKAYQNPHPTFAPSDCGHQPTEEEYQTYLQDFNKGVEDVIRSIRGEQ